MHSIEKLMAAARAAKPTAADREEMRRSFAYGNTTIENDNITREMIDREAEKLEREENERRPA